MSNLTVYIDEAGDPGTKDGLRYLKDRHEWFTFGAFVVRSERESKLVEWVKEMRTLVRARQAGALHYNQISRDRREGLCAHLASKPSRAFVFLSHKSNLRQYTNPRLGVSISAERLYNWSFRLLLEQITAWAAEWQTQEYGGLSRLKIIIAQTGHDYDHFNAYIDRLRWQRANHQLFLQGPGLSEAHLDRTEWSIEPAAKVAGLQIADVIASSFYQGANSASPSFDPAPAIALRPIVEGRRHANDRGVRVWPLPHQGIVPGPSQPLFKTFGYHFD